MSYQEVFSTDVNFSESQFTIIKKDNNLFGFNTMFDCDTNNVYFAEIEIEFPDWIDINEVNKCSDSNYTGEESGDNLYQFIADCVSYYGAYHFGAEMELHTATEIETKFGEGYTFEELTNDQVVDLYFS